MGMLLWVTFTSSHGLWLREFTKGWHSCAVCG
uniref:Uncharacterized protein n=1 Tax=Arundo donax TaxID=35708 RepID=A0A0A9BQ26_ARUDO